MKENLGKNLISYFGEPFVHIDSRIEIQNRIRVDFLVYTKEAKIAFDIFYPDNEYHRFNHNLRDKFDTYYQINIPLYLIIANKDISDEFINKSKKSYQKTFNLNISILNIHNYWNVIGKYNPIDIK